MQTIKKILLSILVVGSPVGGAIIGSIVVGEDHPIEYAVGAIFGFIIGYFALFFFEKITDALKDIWEK